MAASICNIYSRNLGRTSWPLSVAVHKCWRLVVPTSPERVRHLVFGVKKPPQFDTCWEKRVLEFACEGFEPWIG